MFSIYSLQWRYASISFIHPVIHSVALCNSIIIHLLVFTLVFVYLSNFFVSLLRNFIVSLFFPFLSWVQTATIVLVLKVLSKKLMPTPYMCNIG